MVKNTERRLLSMPPDWWAAFAEAATDSGETLSEWLGEAGRKRLPADKRKVLTERKKPGRPAKG